jgi:hypothetical protein
VHPKLRALYLLLVLAITVAIGRIADKEEAGYRFYALYDKIQP